MQLTPELHQEIAQLLSDNVSIVMITSKLVAKGINELQAAALIHQVSVLVEERNKAYQVEAIEEVPLEAPGPTTVQTVASMDDIGFKPTYPRGQRPEFTYVDELAYLPLPVPLPDTSRNFVHVDNVIRVVFRLTGKPNAILFENVLTQAECDTIIAESSVKLERNTVVSVKDGTSAVDSSRTSSGTYFDLQTPGIIERVENRLATLVNWPVARGESIQVMRYQPGEKYSPHYDYFDPKDPGSARHTQNGQRVATLIMYLSDVEEGGSTGFPDIGLHVIPKKGSVLFFSYAEASKESKSLHEGSPVIAGTKWIATKWLRS